MICPRCQKQVASVQVTEILRFVSPGHPENQVEDHRICETCAQELNLPHTGPAQPLANLWKLLQFHKQRATRAPAATPACPDCGMTLEELRRKGRVGCSKDYEVFAEYLEDHLERMHGATDHVGRLPGATERGPEVNVESLRNALEVAIQDEDFERAAALRDEIKTLESGSAT